MPKAQSVEMANTARYEHDLGRHCIYRQHVVVRVLIPPVRGYKRQPQLREEPRPRRGGALSRLLRFQARAGFGRRVAVAASVRRLMYYWLHGGYTPCNSEKRVSGS